MPTLKLSQELRTSLPLRSPGKVKEESEGVGGRRSGEKPQVTRHSAVLDRELSRSTALPSLGYRLASRPARSPSPERSEDLEGKRDAHRPGAVKAASAQRQLHSPAFRPPAFRPQPGPRQVLPASPAPCSGRRLSPPLGSPWCAPRAALLDPRSLAVHTSARQQRGNATCGSNVRRRVPEAQSQAGQRERGAAPRGSLPVPRRRAAPAGTRRRGRADC